jgi:FtsP/CotA-like multicopper oxidase with cupredoxin domain
LVNELPMPTSMHWHGIRIDNRMDGVPGLTQQAVAPGTEFTYDFAVPDAGTYWYHTHNRSVEQMARGLYGALIVEEQAPMDVDREEVLIFDDWRIDPDTAQIDGNFDSPHDRSHAGRFGNYITTNSIYNLSLSARPGERLRLRLINAANARVFPLSLEGLRGWIVALDGMPLDTPQAVAERIVLAPAQRVDLVVDIQSESGETAHIIHFDRNESFSQVAFEIGGAPLTPRDRPPHPLPPNAYTRVNLADATPLTLRMEGGAMGGMRAATLGGEEKSMRELARAGRFWSFNGVADGYEGAPLAELSLGEHVRLAIANDTAFPHAIHLHGMHFHEIGQDGALGVLRDTTLIERGGYREIAFVADNPGQWLLHCHMLSHAASGMSTRLVVG